jgi:hypothetical protein
MKNRYQDVEHLLFKGFIPYQVQVGGLNLVFKTINEHEYERIMLMSGLKDDPRYTSFFNLNYLFYSIYMVDGMNILKNREDHYGDFTDILKQFPTAFFKKINEVLEYLVKRQNNCSISLEQYVLEYESRYNWEYRKNQVLNSSAHTSIGGTEILGMNQFQKYWTVLNVREDNKEKWEQDYSLFKFLASFTDPKAVKKIENIDKVKKEEEEKRKERLRVMGTEEEIKYLASPMDTREGIIKELEKQMRGEKDDHDRYVESYEKSIRKQMLMQMSELQKVKEERRKNVDDLGEEVKSISKQELEERIARIKERKEKNMSAMDSLSGKSPKFYQMSNVKDDQLIREEDFLSEEDYVKLTGDETYQALTGDSEEDRKRAELEYKKQQKTLASKFKDDDDTLDLDFPHLKR